MNNQTQVVNYTYFNGKKDKTINVNSMKKYANQKQEMDKVLEEIITPYINEKELKILDLCCGVGHISHLLATQSPKSKILGIDQTPYLIEEARSLFHDNNVSFEIADLYDLPLKYPKEFDISVNWKTISWLPYYDECIKSLVSLTKNHIFLSSLFYDGDIDFQIKVREYKKESSEKGFNAYYNVYSFPRFKEFVYDLGAKNVKAMDFKIDIDIPRPPIDSMGTYTEKLDDGRRLQISGAVLMLWKIVRIDL